MHGHLQSVPNDHALRSKKRLRAVLGHLTPLSGDGLSSGICAPNICSSLPRVAALRKKLKVAIIGAGVGGSSLAQWLREAFGDDLSLTVFSDGPIGGRCQTIEFEGKKYEAGASIISEVNEHFIAIMKRCGLRERCVKDVGFSPMGVFNGKEFVVQSASPSKTRFAKPLSTLDLIRRYGFFGLRRLQQIAKGPGAPDFDNLYAMQNSGVAFSQPVDLLAALGAHVPSLVDRSAEAWLVEDKRIPANLVHELVTGGMRANYGGQSCGDLHALVGLVSVVGGIASRCFSVIGGNDQIPKFALEAAAPRLITDTALKVSRCSEADGKRNFSVCYGQGDRQEEDFDVVAIAHPLERSTLQFENCHRSSVEKLGSFQRCVAHFVKGVLRPEYFGVRRSDLPVEVLTTRDSSAPFYSIGLQYPISADAQDVQQILSSALEGKPQVYKVFAPRVLSDDELSTIFAPDQKVDGPVNVRSVGFYAYPAYEVPQKLQPFVLDSDGLFYVNAIEQAASAMEMSMISARNVANLIFRWVEERRSPDGF